MTKRSDAKSKNLSSPHPGGRPTKYRSEFCKMLIEHMSKGLSFESFAAIADVHIETIYEWANTHLEFSEAKKTAFARNLLWWESQGTKGLWNEKEAPTLNTTLWIFNMKNRHRWRDRQDIEMQATVQELERQKIQAMPMNELIETVKTLLPEES